MKYIFNRSANISQGDDITIHYTIGLNGLEIDAFYPSCLEKYLEKIKGNITAAYWFYISSPTSPAFWRGTPPCASSAVLGTTVTQTTSWRCSMARTAHASGTRPTSPSTAATRTYSNRQRAILYKIARSIIHRDAPFVYLAYPNQHPAFGTTVQGFIINPAGRYFFYPAYIWPEWRQCQVGNPTKTVDFIWIERCRKYRAK